MGGLSAVHCHCCQLVTDVLIHCFCYKCYKLSPPADHNNQLVSNKESKEREREREVALTVTTTSKEDRCRSFLYSFLVLFNRIE